MQPRIVECRALPNARLWVRFDDNAAGTLDLAHLVGKGVFERWRNPEFFSQVSVDATTGTVMWPGAIDLDPHVLRNLITGEAITSQPIAEARRSWQASAILSSLVAASFGITWILAVTVTQSRWIWGIPLVFFLTALAFESWRRSHLRPIGRCPKCEYELRGLPPLAQGGIRCPECGSIISE